MTAPPLAEETPFGRRYRNFRTGEIAPSITTILKVINKEQVNSWAVGMAANCANENWDEMTDWHPSRRKLAMVSAHQEYTDERSRIGTLVHETCEALIKGVPVEIPKEISGYISQFSKFVMEKQPRWIESEVTVWSRYYGYAGTADAVAEIDGKTWLIDFKTGKSAHPENGLQLAALRYAGFIIRPDCSEEEMMDIGCLGILHLRPRSHKLIPVKRDEECFRAFKAALELHRWKDEVADHVLGEAA